MKKITKTVLKVLSSIDIDMKKNYKMQRAFNKIAHFHYLQILYKTKNDGIHVEDHLVPVRIFFPKEDSQKLIIYFHGGGWVTGDIDSYDKTCSVLASETKHIIISVDYRLAPEYPFPAGLSDCYGVTQEILKKASELGVLLENITIMGDSAGGNLAAAVSLMARDRNELVPFKQILLYPSTYHDHSTTSPYYSVIENGEDWLLTSKKIGDYMNLYVSSLNDFHNPYVAPLLSSDFSNQPRTLIITAEMDPLRDEGEAYGNKLMEAGNDVEVHRILDSIHGFFTLSLIPKPIQESYRYIYRFLNGDDYIEKKK